MRNKLIMFAATVGLSLSTSCAFAEIDWPKVDAAIGKPAAVSGNVHRYGLPRGDLRVVLDGVAIKPALALGGWIAFEPSGAGAMMMGDLVLTESEVNPVISLLLVRGIEVTAIHNHLLRASPATFYLHVNAHGDPAELARGVRDALAESKTPFDPPSPTSSGPSPEPGFDAAKIESVIGFKGRDNKGVYQFSVPRTDAIKVDNATIAGAMGAANVINFQPTGGGKAAITGDFVALAKEIGPLLKALRSNGVEVTAIHNHMLDDEPRAFFVHFWANDDAVKLAHALRAALDAVHVPAGG